MASAPKQARHRAYAMLAPRHGNDDAAIVAGRPIRQQARLDSLRRSMPNDSSSRTGSLLLASGIPCRRKSSFRHVDAILEAGRIQAERPIGGSKLVVLAGGRAEQ